MRFHKILYKRFLESLTTHTTAERDIGDSSATLAPYVDQYGGQTIDKIIDVTTLSGGESMVESTQNISESSTQRTTHTSTQQGTESSSIQQTVQGIRASIGKEVRSMREAEGESCSSSVIGQTETDALQENTSWSLECVDTITESTEVFDFSSRESMQTSTQQNSTPRMAVGQFSNYGGEKSSNIVSSVRDVSGSLDHETVHGITVEAIAIEHKNVTATPNSSGSTGFNIQSGEIVQTSAQEIYC